MKSAHVVLPRRIVQPTVAAVVTALLATALSVLGVPAATAAGPCTVPIVSKVACENTQPGNPASEWQVSGAGDSTIQGFATSMSVNVGEAVDFKIQTPSTSYTSMCTDWAITKDWARARSRQCAAERRLAADPTCVRHVLRDGPRGLRKLGGIRVLAGPGFGGIGSLPGSFGAQ